MKEGQYWRATNIKRHGTKFSGQSHLALGNCGPLRWTI